MDIINIDNEAFENLFRRFKRLTDRVETVSNKMMNTGLKKWLDNQDVCELLKISPRTLQTYRDNGTIGFSKIEGKKIYYRPQDVSELLRNSKNNKIKLAMSELINNESDTIKIMIEMMDSMEKRIDEIELLSHPSFLGEVFLTDSEVSAHLHVSKRTLSDWRMKGMIDYIQLPGKIIYPSSAIQRMLDAHYQKSFNDRYDF